MKCFKIQFVLLPALALFLAGLLTSQAQVVQTGIIDGFVRDEDGSPVGGVFITLESRGVNAQKISTISDFEGHFRVPGLPPGVYYVSAHLEGYQQLGELRVNLRVNQVQRILVELREGIGSERQGPEADVFLNSLYTDPFEETVPISPIQPEMVDVRQLDREWLFSDLRHIDRWLIIDDMAAGQVEVSWDSVHLIDPWDGSVAVNSQSLPYQNLDIRSRFLPPIDTAPAGALQFQSAPLERNLHGAFSSGFQVNAQSGDDSLSEDLLARDGRAGLVLTRQFTETGTSLMFTGSYTRRQFSNLIDPLEKSTDSSLLVDGRYIQRISSGSEFVLRGIHSYDKYEALNAVSRQRWRRVAPLQTPISDTVSRSFSSLGLSFQQRLSENITISYQANASQIERRREPTSGDLEQATSRDSFAGSVYNGSMSGTWSDQLTRRLGGSGDIEFFLDEITGTHQIHVGLDAEYSRNERQWAFNGSVLRELREDRIISRQFYFEPDGGRTDPDSLSTLTRFSIFARDNWLISPRLMVNIGIRFDATDIENSTTRVLDWNAVSPRIGVSFDTFNDGSLIVRAGLARYFDQARIQRSMPDPYGLATNYQVAALERLDLPEQLLRPSLTRQRFGYDLAWRPGDVTTDPPRTDEIFASVEFSPGEHFISSISYAWRKTTDILDDQDFFMLSSGVASVGEFSGWLPRSAIDTSGNAYTWYEQVLNSDGDLSQALFWGTDDRLFRRYHQLRLRASAALSSQLTLRGVYTWSSTRGNIGVDGEAVSSRSEVNNTPARFINATGYLDSHQRHRARLIGVFRLRDTSFSVGLSYQSGAPYDRFLFNPAFSSLIHDIRADPRGEVYFYDSQLLLDARLEHSFHMGDNRLVAGLELYNLLDDRSIVRVDQRDGPTFQTPLEVNPPRRLGMTLTYQF